MNNPSPHCGYHSPNRVVGLTTTRDNGVLHISASKATNIIIFNHK